MQTDKLQAFLDSRAGRLIVLGMVILLAVLIVGGIVFVVFSWWKRDPGPRPSYQPRPTFIMIATVAGRLQHYFSPENQWETFCNLIRVVLRIHQLRMELPRFDLEWSFTSRDLHDNREPNPVVFVVPRRSIPQETVFRDSEISADPGRLSSL